MDVSLTRRPPSETLLRLPLRQPTVRLQELSCQSQERLEVACSDPAGNAFHLTVERSTSVYVATYDRLGGLDRGGHSYGRRSRGFAGGTENVDEGLRGSSEATRGFRRLLHDLLKAVDPAYAERWSGFDARGGDARVVAASETVTVTVTLEVTGAPGFDYWSEERTAGRLVDVATSLFRGGDRSAHAEQMGAAMERGYRDAADAFGGVLPEIARRTVDLARERLGAWASEPTRLARTAESERLDLAA